MSDHRSGSRRLQPIVREPTLSSRVTTQLEKLIVEDHFQPGSRLPSERQLAEQFGVSRTVVREATRALVAKGWLDVQPGSGTRVRSPTMHSISQSITLLLRLAQSPTEYEKVHEVRRLLEIEIAGLAAERRTDEDLVEIEVYLNKMIEGRENLDVFSQSDVAFHTALARATHNEMFVIVLNSVVDVMVQVRRVGSEPLHIRDYGIAAHQKIFEQVRAGNREGAREAMAEHLNLSVEIYQRGAATIRTLKDLL